MEKAFHAIDDLTMQNSETIEGRDYNNRLRLLPFVKTLPDASGFFRKNKLRELLTS